MAGDCQHTNIKHAYKIHCTRLKNACTLSDWRIIKHAKKFLAQLCQCTYYNITTVLAHSWLSASSFLIAWSISHDPWPLWHWSASEQLNKNWIHTCAPLYHHLLESMTHWSVAGLLLALMNTVVHSSMHWKTVSQVTATCIKESSD